MLIALSLGHGDELPSDCREKLNELIGYAADGASKTWAGALEGGAPELLGGPKLSWDSHGLKVSHGGTELFIRLPQIPEPREIDGRAAAN